MDMDTNTARGGTVGLARVLPLMGIAYAALTVAGDLTIGPFPSGSSPQALVSYYRDHHTQVGVGGMLLGWAAVCFAFFAAALYVRVRVTSAAVAAAVIVGAAVETAAQGFSAAVYSTLGDIGADPSTNPIALQAWHIWGSEFGMGIGLAVLGVAVALASLVAGALPRWLGISGLVLGLAQLTPFGFFASLVFLLWAAAAGVVLARQPLDRAPTTATTVGAVAEPV